MDCLRVGDSVIWLQADTVLSNKMRTSEFKGRSDELSYVGSSEWLHEVLGGLDISVAVLQFPEFGEIVDPASMADPVIVVALVERNFFWAPSLIEILTQQSPKLDDVEDNDSIQKGDDEDEHKFFSPGHSHIWAFHSSDIP